MNERGLTLIEVLAATVLLGITAAACVPILTSAMRVLHEEQADAVALDNLAMFADGVVADPESFGLTIAQLHELDSIEIPWQEEGVSVTIKSKRAEGTAIRHSLLIFTTGAEGARTVFRWIERPPPEEETAQ